MSIHKPKTLFQTSNKRTSRSGKIKMLCDFWAPGLACELIWPLMRERLHCLSLWWEHRYQKEGRIERNDAKVFKQLHACRLFTCSAFLVLFCSIFLLILHPGEWRRKNTEPRRDGGMVVKDKGLQCNAPTHRAHCTASVCAKRLTGEGRKRWRGEAGQGCVSLCCGWADRAWSRFVCTGWTGETGCWFIVLHKLQLQSEKEKLI